MASWSWCPEVSFLVLFLLLRSQCLLQRESQACRTHSQLWLQPPQELRLWVPNRGLLRGSPCPPDSATWHMSPGTGEAEAAGPRLSHTPSSTWAVGESQSLPSLSLHPSRGPLGPACFTSRQRTVPLAWFCAFRRSMTNLGDPGCSGVRHQTFLIGPSRFLSLLGQGGCLALVMFLR